MRKTAASACPLIVNQSIDIHSRVGLTEEGWLYCVSSISRGTQDTLPTKSNFNSVITL